MNEVIRAIDVGEAAAIRHLRDLGLKPGWKFLFGDIPQEHRLPVKRLCRRGVLLEHKLGKVTMTSAALEALTRWLRNNP